mmetsp:Transcript_69672/g.137891  ORF Transcript_69672/g.137891 Transcript_69672/m.137891 type:complete len:253 (+) Transcript_69672:365-1123(+)
MRIDVTQYSCHSALPMTSKSRVQVVRPIKVQNPGVTAPPPLNRFSAGIPARLTGAPTSLMQLIGSAIRLAVAVGLSLPKSANQLCFNAASAAGRFAGFFRNSNLIRSMPFDDTRPVVASNSGSSLQMRCTSALPLPPKGGWPKSNSKRRQPADQTSALSLHSFFLSTSGAAVVMSTGRSASIRMPLLGILAIFQKSPSFAPWRSPFEASRTCEMRTSRCISRFLCICCNAESTFLTTAQAPYSSSWLWVSWR